MEALRRTTLAELVAVRRHAIRPRPIPSSPSATNASQETMAHLEIRNLHVQAGDKQILNGLDIDVHSGEVHALMGPNGSGKSTLANAIMGHPGLEVTEGQILLDGEDITEADPDERARMGLFMAFQYPVSIPGVTITKYLRMVMNAHREARGEPEVPLKEFRKTVEAAMELTNVPREWSSRYLNEGFSGGEKKRLEILQLALQQPQIAVMDETDSGLDIDALNVVAHGVNTVVQGQRHGHADHHPLPAHPAPGPAHARVDHVRRAHRQGGRARARRAARGQGLRLDPRGGRRERLTWLSTADTLDVRGRVPGPATGTASSTSTPARRRRSRVP